MRHGLHTTQRQEQSLRIDPRVLLSSQLLVLGQADLEQAIETELNENPALDRIQDDIEPLTEERVLRVVAPSELGAGSEDQEFRRSLPNDEDPVSWVDLVATVPVIKEHVKAQIKSLLPPELRSAGEYVVDCLTPGGYLHELSEEIALSTNCTLEQVEQIVQALQRCEPRGIGARTVPECLLLQLREDHSYEGRLARQILRDFLGELIARRTMRIARRFDVMPEVVQQAFDKILKLCPYPIEELNTAPGATTPSHGILPEVILVRAESGWSVEVAGPVPSALRVSRSYDKRLGELNKLARPDRDERRHIVTHVQRARDFISCLEQRRKTLKAIGEFLITNQLGFVSTGDYAFLKPLTRAQMAETLGMHESTMSRATSDKFVQIASGEVVPFEVFFKPALRVQKMIEDILSTENPAEPLSDERIAELLAAKGVAVARRTVNKYRDRTRLLSSRKRKTA